MLISIIYLPKGSQDLCRVFICKVLLGAIQRHTAQTNQKK